MADFIAKYWLEVLFGIIVAILGIIQKKLQKELKAYKALVKKEQQEKLEQQIDLKLEPILEDIEEIRKHVTERDMENDTKLNLIVSSYRFRLIQLCKIYLKQGYLTTEQYEQINEFYDLYFKLGGNGQAKEFYEQVLKLEICDSK